MLSSKVVLAVFLSLLAESVASDSHHHPPGHPGWPGAPNPGGHPGGYPGGHPGPHHSHPPSSPPPSESDNPSSPQPSASDNPSSPQPSASGNPSNPQPSASGSASSPEPSTSDTSSPGSKKRNIKLRSASTCPSTATGRYNVILISASNSNPYVYYIPYDKKLHSFSSGTLCTNLYSPSDCLPCAEINVGAVTVVAGMGSGECAFFGTDKGEGRKWGPYLVDGSGTPPGSWAPDTPVNPNDTIESVSCGI